MTTDDQKCINQYLQILKSDNSNRLNAGRCQLPITESILRENNIIYHSIANWYLHVLRHEDNSIPAAK